VSSAAPTAMELGLQGCDTCGLLSRPTPGEEEGRCPRCDEELTFRKRASLQRTWAFLIAAAVCYIPANLLPVLTTTTATGTEEGNRPTMTNAITIRSTTTRATTTRSSTIRVTTETMAAVAPPWIRAVTTPTVAADQAARVGKPPTDGFWAGSPESPGAPANRRLRLHL